MLDELDRMTRGEGNMRDGEHKGYKKCVKCGKEKPWGPAWFYQEPYRGLTLVCKDHLPPWPAQRPEKCGTGEAPTK